MCLVAVAVVHFCSYLGGVGGSHVGNSSVVALVFGFGMDWCQIWIPQVCWSLGSAADQGWASVPL